MEWTLTHLYHGVEIDWFGLNAHVLWNATLYTQYATAVHGAFVMMTQVTDYTQ